MNSTLSYYDKFGSKIRYVLRQLKKLYEIFPPKNGTDLFSEDKMFISLKEAATHCDYSPEYLSLLARKGRLAAVKMNNKDWMTTKEAIEEYIQSRRTISKT